MLEFALIVPVLMFLIFGTLEGSFVVFSSGTAAFAAAEAGRAAAEEGNKASTDTDAVKAVRDSALGTTRLATVNEIDIYRLTEDAAGNLNVDNSHYNRYNLNGSVIGTVNWNPTTRNVANTTMDFLGVTIDFTYHWRTGFFTPMADPHLTSIYYVRLEPQLYN
jgi:Flp pilus assembly protein TadG